MVDGSISKVQVFETHPSHGGLCAFTCPVVHESCRPE